MARKDAAEDPRADRSVDRALGAHHAVACSRILAHLDFLDETIGALTEQIDARTAAFEAVYTSLLPVPGFDRLTIDVIVAETGADMTRFPTAADLAAWTGVCPGSHESAGKRRNVGPGREVICYFCFINVGRGGVCGGGKKKNAQYRRSPAAAGPTKQPSPSLTR